MRVMRVMRVMRIVRIINVKMAKRVLIVVVVLVVHLRIPNAVWLPLFFLRMPEDCVIHGTEGTYEFFSPEMCATGYKGHDGRHADIWATGISLWAFLFSSLPFLHKEFLNHAF